jgi:hypothetical protein
MRQPTPPTQLEWVPSDSMRGDELPVDVRDRARELLARLLQDAARGARPPEGPDELA